MPNQYGIINLSIYEFKGLEMGTELQETKKQEVSTDVQQFEDKLNRRILAKNFVSVLKSQHANVFSINGGWGTGKTWFLKFVEDECNKQGLPFVQYNVWETDYINDPLTAIFSELIKKVIKVFNASEIVIKDRLMDKEEKKNWIKKIKNRFQFFYENTYISKVSPYIEYSQPDGSSIRMGTEVERAVRAKSEFVTEEEIKYFQMKEAKKSLIEGLKEIVSMIKPNQIVIAIDELDRCRPDYAIKTLEVIKHFFHIEGIKFILAVDKDQLANTVKVMFGQKAETDCYLRKFVDIEYNLPVSNQREYFYYLIAEKYSNISDKIDKFSENNSILYWGRDYDRGEERWRRGGNDEDSRYVSNSFTTVLEASKLSLRDMDKILLRLSIIFDNLDETEDVLELGFLLELIILNDKNPSLFMKNQQGVTFSSMRGNKLYEPLYSKTIELDNLIKDKQNNPNNSNVLHREIPYLLKYYDYINMSASFEST